MPNVCYPGTRGKANLLAASTCVRPGNQLAPLRVLDRSATFVQIREHSTWCAIGFGDLGRFLSTDPTDCHQHLDKHVPHHYSIRLAVQIAERLVAGQVLAAWVYFLQVVLKIQVGCSVYNSVWNRM